MASRHTAVFKPVLLVNRLGAAISQKIRFLFGVIFCIVKLSWRR